MLFSISDCHRDGPQTGAGTTGGQAPCVWQPLQAGQEEQHVHCGRGGKFRDFGNFFLKWQIFFHVQVGEVNAAVSSTEGQAQQPTNGGGRRRRAASEAGTSATAAATTSRPKRRPGPIDPSRLAAWRSRIFFLLN